MQIFISRYYKYVLRISWYVIVFNRWKDKRYYKHILKLFRYVETNFLHSMLHVFSSFHTFLDALIKQKNQWHSWGDKKVRIAGAAMCHVSGLSLIFGAIMSMTAMDSRHFGMGSSCMLPLLSWIALRASGGGLLTRHVEVSQYLLYWEGHILWYLVLTIFYCKFFQVCLSMNIGFIFPDMHEE